MDSVNETSPMHVSLGCAQGRLCKQMAENTRIWQKRQAEKERSIDANQLFIQ